MIIKLKSKRTGVIYEAYDIDWNGNNHESHIECFRKTGIEIEVFCFPKRLLELVGKEKTHER